MKSTYFAALLVSSLLTVGTATFPTAQPVLANPCAGQINPCAANPCAGQINPCAANPCAGQINPCAANPCAGQINPCAANPCAGRINPCAANPCAANPCAANPCAANPCAANPCAASAFSAGTKTGSFEGVGHTSLGQATIIEENGNRYLEFDETFRSDNGPDLFVLLHQQAEPSSYSPELYENLGRLKAVSGTQRYEIPAGVSLDEVQSAVIWCRQFDVTFGFATF